jgi:hypothetical protein
MSMAAGWRFDGGLAASENRRTQGGATFAALLLFALSWLRAFSGDWIKPAWTGTMELSGKAPSPTCALCNKKIGAIRLCLIYCPDEDESRGSR